MKNRNLFWGLFFILSAVFVIGIQMGSFVHIGFISILATVLLAAIFIHSVLDVEFFGMFISLALLYMIYRQPLHMPDISPWLLLLAAVFAGMGFSFIFHTHRKKSFCCRTGLENFEKTNEDIDNNYPCVKVSLGSSSKYLHADCLRGGQFTCSLGDLEVFFDQVQLSPDGAEIFVECSLGAIELYIPRSWRVIDNTRASLGSIENNTRLNQVTENSPRLTITGNVSLGSMEIHYI